jgi:pimeloyl-ACP methyl ester carboxylesterase
VHYIIALYLTEKENTMKSIKTIAAAAIAGIALNAAAAPAQVKPTIVLVHGAFADSSSWDGVSKKLIASGYRVIGAANPLRSVKADAAVVSGIVKGIDGPVVLVGHSYGGAVISAAANGNSNVKSLVYVAAFAPEANETALELSGRFPGGTLGSALAAPVPTADGGKDFYIDQAKFHKQFAADVSPAQASLMAAGQRPIAEAALTEAAGAPAWKNLPSYFVYGTADKKIPAAALQFMADRAKSRKTVVIEGASHVVMTSRPAQVARLIEQAAAN